jgi:hypothetical protein
MVAAAAQNVRRDFLTTRQLNRALLARQLLLERKHLSVRDAIHAVGGLQTQEPRDAFVALWSRLGTFQPEHLHAAALSREIVRATYMRGTIHTASADDYAAFRGLLQPMLERSLKSWRAFSGGFAMHDLEPAARALMRDGALNAQQMGEALAAAFPDAHTKGLAHWIRTCIALIIVPTDDRWGYSRPPRFVPADQWLTQPLDKKPSITQLVLRCLSAIGPATSPDVRAWSGIGAITPALEQLRPQLMSFQDERGRELFDLPGAPRPHGDTPAPVRFLPEYDNTFLSHAERARIIPPEHAQRFVVSKNGRRPCVALLDGFVRASWRITRQHDTATIQVTLFEKCANETVREISAEAEALLRFLEPDAASFAVNVNEP